MYKLFFACLFTLSILADSPVSVRGPGWIAWLSEALSKSKHSVSEDKYTQLQQYANDHEKFKAAVEQNFPVEAQILRGKNTPSAESKGKQYDEYNRTLMAMRIFFMLRNNDYQILTTPQTNPSSKLTPEQCNALSDLTKQLNHQEAQAVIYDLLSNDFGKFDNIKAAVNNTRVIQLEEHDLIGTEYLQKFGNTLPGFQGLSSHPRNLILKTRQANFNLGQLLQLECPQKEVEGYKTFNAREKLVFLIEALCDIAGAQGHVNNTGSTILAKPFATSFFFAKDALLTDDPYNKFLRKKAQIFGFVDESSEITQKATTLTRLAAMTRRSDQTSAAEIKNAFEQLEEKTQNILITELSKTGVSDRAIKLEYSPALLMNALGGKSAEALASSMRLLAKLFVLTSEKDLQKEGVLTVHINAIASSPEIKENTKQAAEKEIEIEVVNENEMKAKFKK
ncbi:MAG: hypothetical protein M1114_03790 [Candidatus Dependentiae bacterium]|nr:hypothetical protein [Candidatus Dependentiae bacterium]